MPDPSRTAAWVRKQCPLRPRLAFILGSGFSKTLGPLENAHEIPYPELPGFHASGVDGHAGKLLMGKVQGHAVAALEGRCHFYEGHDMEAVTFPIRVLHALGIEELILTNAAGAIRRRMKPGQFMVVTDHLNFMGLNPLRGAPAQKRFIDLTNAYDPGLRRTLLQASRAVKLKVHSGVYLAVSGPSYETPAEIKAFGRLGADAVGMSTVPETIVARQCGLRVAAVSCLTNMAAGLAPSPISHHEVLATASLTRARATDWFRTFIALRQTRPDKGTLPPQPR